MYRGYLGPTNQPTFHVFQANAGGARKFLKTPSEGGPLLVDHSESLLLDQFFQGNAGGTPEIYESSSDDEDTLLQAFFRKNCELLSLIFPLSL